MAMPPPQKAKSLVSAAVARTCQQEPLQSLDVPVNPAILVVGGGIAGIQAAIELANAGNLVYLVEREPSIGGHMALIIRDVSGEVVERLFKGMEAL